MRCTLALAAAASFVGFVHAQPPLPTWSVDAAGSTLNVNATATADNGDNGFAPGPFFTDTVAGTGFIPGFAGPLAPHDFGNAVNPRGRDQAGPFSLTSSSAVSEVFVDGDGSRTLTVHFRVNGLMDSYGPDAYLANSLAGLAGSLSLAFGGLAAGQNVDIDYDWTFFGNAVTDHEGVLEDPASSSGFATLADPAGVGTPFFFEAFDGDNAALPAAGSGSGSGRISFIASAPGDAMVLDFGALAASVMAAPGDQGIAIEDLGGSEFIGDITLRIVPAPGPATLAALGLTCLRIRRRN